MTDYLFNQVSFRKKVLFMVYTSQVWIPLRRRLIKDHKNRTWRNQQTPAGSEDLGYESYDTDKLLPPLSSIIKFYFTFSTGTHIMNALINAIFIINGGPKVSQDSYLGLLRCHSHRVLVHNLVSQDWIMWFGCALSGMHVIWRIVMVIYEREFMLDAIIFLLVDKENLEKLSDHRKTLQVYRRYSSLDCVQRILFYRIDNPGENSLEFVLKPGRKGKDRAVLESMVEMCVKVAIVVTLTTLIVAAPLGIYAFATDLDFYYPNCNTQGYDLVFINRFFGSLNLSLIFVLDSFLAIFFPVMTSLILAYDLMVYWSHVESKLQALAQILRANNNDINADQPQNSHLLSLKYDQMMMRELNDNLSRDKILDRRIIELQSLMGDFFAQLQRADQYTSILLGFVFGIWLAFHGIITFSGIRDNNRTTAVVTAGAQFIFFMILVVLSYLILLLKRRTEPAYNVICSIMALDPSLDKRRWAVLLKYYTIKPRYAFTIVHAKVFSLGLFIKTFSYTFTFALFVESVRLSRF